MEHNDIDFRKAVRPMEEARDRLDEASGYWAPSIAAT